MSPLEQIKSGILTANMDEVKAGYEALTGASLDVPQTKRTTAKKAATKKPTRKTAKKTTRKKVATKADTKGGFIIKEKEPDLTDGQVRWTENLFESMIGYSETMTEEESSLVNELIGKGGQKPKIAGDSYKPIDMFCDGCKKTKSVNPAYIVPTAQYYYCDNCLDKRR